MGEAIWVGVSVTAYFTSDEVNFEKSVRAIVQINAADEPDWAGLMEAFAKAAIDPKETPMFEGQRLMTEAEIEEYRREQDGE